MYSRLAATVAAGVLVMSGLATGTANADNDPTTDAITTEAVQPQTPIQALAPIASHAVTCGRVAITVTKPADAVVALQYRVNGRRTVTKPIALASQTVEVAVREDSGVRSVWYRLAGQKQWSDRVRVESDCRPNFKRADAPSVVQPECDAAKGKLVIPADRGVTYKVRTATRDYRVFRAGEYDVRPGTYWVRADAKPGVKLVGARYWKRVVEAAEACPTPTPTPTATDEPTPDPTPTEEPTVEPEPTKEPTEEPEPQPTVTETETRTTTKVVVVGNVRVPGRVDTGAGGLVTAAK